VYTIEFKVATFTYCPFSVLRAIFVPGSFVMTFLNTHDVSSWAEILGERHSRTDITMPGNAREER
jgi:hypothetical protein